MSDNYTKTHLQELIRALVNEGESKEELFLWFDLFEAMDAGEQKKLLQNLEKELEDLKKLK